MSESQIPIESSMVVEFSGQQLALYKALAKKNILLATIYSGAISVYGQNTNSDRLALAAHGLRELIEKLPRYLDMPMDVKLLNMMETIRPFQASWISAKTSACLSNSSWKGEIDSPLQTYLEQSDVFFTWLVTNRLTRSQQVGKVVRHLDPQGRPLPSAIEELRIRELDHCRDYFEAVSHHSGETLSEKFDQWLAVLEIFLLDRLSPRTYEDRSLIDEIIREGEANAKP